MKLSKVVLSIAVGVLCSMANAKSTLTVDEVLPGGVANVSGEIKSIYCGISWEAGYCVVRLNLSEASSYIIKSFYPADQKRIYKGFQLTNNGDEMKFVELADYIDGQYYVEVDSEGLLVRIIQWSTDFKRNLPELTIEKFIESVRYHFVGSRVSATVIVNPKITWRDK